MKIALEILGYLLSAVAIGAAVNFLIQKLRQTTADKKGVVVYATLISAEPVKMFGKAQGDLTKVTLRIQEPGESKSRDVTMRTRVDASQPLQAGLKVPVVIDPKNPKRVYPASPKAAKRAVVTGSRLERRTMETQLRTPGRQGPRPPSGYQPPTGSINRGKRR
jgi:hypothetical protein